MIYTDDENLGDLIKRGILFNLLMKASKWRCPVVLDTGTVRIGIDGMRFGITGVDISNECLEAAIAHLYLYKKEEKC